jgi:sugar phosphate permease
MGIWTGSFFFGQFISPVLVHQASGATGSMQGAFVTAGVVSLVVAIGALTMGMTRGRTPLMA